MKIIVNKEPFEEDCEYSYDSQNYNLSCTIDIPDDATATQVAEAVAKAMEIDGYHKSSIANAFYNYAKYLAHEYKFELKDDEE